MHLIATIKLLLVSNCFEAELAAGERFDYFPARDKIICNGIFRAAMKTVEITNSDRICYSATFGDITLRVFFGKNVCVDIYRDEFFILCYAVRCRDITKAFTHALAETIIRYV